MNDETRYQLQKRINELKQENEKLKELMFLHKTITHKLYSDCIELVGKGSTEIRVSYILFLMKGILK